MWSMWTAPSDRDYYGTCDPEPEEERCYGCGSGELEACEEWCETQQPAAEPAPAAPAVPADPPRHMRYYVLAWEKQEVA
jgi:hypothetical protein